VNTTDIVVPGYPPPTEAYTMRDASSIVDCVVHHTAGPKNQTPLERTRGDIAMPYNYLIDDAGTVYTGRPTLAVSAASYGRNQESVAICLIGNFQRDDPGFNGPPSHAALTALYDLVLLVHRQYPSITRTYPHGAISDMFFGGDSDYATECAGDQLGESIPGIKSRVAAILRKH
jgi:hypothetical protein